MERAHAFARKRADGYISVPSRSAARTRGEPLDFECVWNEALQFFFTEEHATLA